MREDDVWVVMVMLAIGLSICDCPKITFNSHLFYFFMNIYAV